MTDPTTDARLPVHGFVLAGGKSSRMGRDKALLPFRGRPLVEIAVQKLRSLCANVSIAGNRDDLAAIAPVIPEQRFDCGPVAGIEAGLRACAQPWALFIPVDVPRVPVSLLANWTRVVVQTGDSTMLSYLRVGDDPQPAFCLLHRDCTPALSAVVDCGVLKLVKVFDQVASQLGPTVLWIADAETLNPPEENSPPLDCEACFANVNTPGDLVAAERCCTDAPTTQ